MKKYLKLIVALLLLFGIDYAGSSILMSGLNRGYGLNTHAKILIVGHSHLMMGLDRYAIENGLNCSVAKYTRSGVDLSQRRLMTMQYLNSQYSDKLQIAILGVDPFSFNGEGLSSNSYTVFYPFMDNKEISEYIWDNTSTLNYLGHKLFRLSRYGTDLLNESLKGWKGLDVNTKTDTLSLETYEAQKGKWQRDIGFNTLLMDQLTSCVNVLVEKNIHVVLLNTPTAQVLNDYQKDKYDKIISYYTNFANSSPLIDFIDYSPSYSSRTDFFFDPIHLNQKGQKEITKRLVSDLASRNILK